MSHLVESMFSVRETPWHQLGTVLSDAPKSIEYALSAAGLDWTVRRSTVHLNDGTVIPEKRAIVRDSDGAVLGVVGETYHPLQNVDAFRFFDPIIQDGRGHYETAGSLRGGRIVWVLARLNETFEPVAGDPVCPYVMLANSHDGSRAVQARFTPIRVVCNNTLTAALARDASPDRAQNVRHLSRMHAHLGEAQRTLGLISANLEATVEIYRAFAERQLRSAEIEAYLRSVVPDNRKAARHTRTENIRTDIMTLIESGRGTEIPGVRGTLWGAYNAVTEYVDHHRGIPLEDVFDAETLDTRLDSMVFGNGAVVKERALSAAKALLA